MSDATSRALRGIEAAAFVLRHAVEAYAVAGGEGARRVAAALEALCAGGPEGSGERSEDAPVRLEGAGLDAARAALGMAAAGRRTALLVSGDAAADVLPSVREYVRLGLPVLLVVPSHGPDVGATWPSAEPTDLAVLALLPVGLLVAADATQTVELLLAGQRAAADRGAPFAVAFPLGAVGLSLSSVALPSARVVRSFAAEATAPSAAPSATDVALDATAVARAAERFTFALNAALRAVERALGRPLGAVLPLGEAAPGGAVAREADLVVLAAGPAARAAATAAAALRAQGGRAVSVVQLAALRPFPAAEVVRQAWRARAVLAHEPLHDGLGGGGLVSAAVRAAFADALTWHPAFAGIGRIPPVVTAFGEGSEAGPWLAALRAVTEASEPARLVALREASGGSGAATGEARIDALLEESEREHALRLAVEGLARAGVRVRAYADGPARASVALRSPRAVHALLVCAGVPFDASRAQVLGAGGLLVLAGDLPDRVLAEAMRAAAARGVRVVTLGAPGTAVRPAAALAALVRCAAGDAALDEPFADAARALGEGPALGDELRAHVTALAPHFA